MILTHIKIPEPVNIVIAAILLQALTTLKYCAVSVLHRNLACQFPFPFLRVYKNPDNFCQDYFLQSQDFFLQSQDFFLRKRHFTKNPDKRVVKKILTKSSPKILTNGS